MYPQMKKYFAGEINFIPYSKKTEKSAIDGI
jgi:hypothetical protein